MIEETIRQIEARLNASTTLTPETRQELTTLLAQLRAEAAQLPPSERTAIEQSTPPESAEEHALQLRGAVDEFEESHPQVVQLVNHLANTLAGLGI